MIRVSGRAKRGSKPKHEAVKIPRKKRNKASSKNSTRPQKRIQPHLQQKRQRIRSLSQVGMGGEHMLRRLPKTVGGDHVGDSKRYQCLPRVEKAKTIHYGKKSGRKIASGIGGRNEALDTETADKQTKQTNKQRTLQLIHLNYQH